MALRELNTEWDEVLILDLLSGTERIQHRISQDLQDLLSRESLGFRRIDCDTKEEVLEALQGALARAQDRNCMIHFTAHGNTAGIGNNVGMALINWADLRKPLTDLNKAFNGNLIVNMVACEGISGLEIINIQDAQEPYYALIGPTRTLTFSEAYSVTQKFYQKLIQGKEIPSVVIEIIKEQGENIIWAETAQRRINPTMSLQT